MKYKGLLLLDYSSELLDPYIQYTGYNQLKKYKQALIQYQ